MKKGMVYIVGAGPGDEGLITVKATHCLAISDIVIYDNLVNTDLLAYCPAHCERIFVGKKAEYHTVPQEEINQLIIKKAEEGLTITRLKGGDPFIFGRGGEEALELVKASIPFEIVPGITAAIAAAAYAGIPTTQRGYTSSLAFITGHEHPEKMASDLDWSKIATGIGTIVLYMGVKNLPYIVEQLITNGRASNTPIAIIEWGTYPQQRTITGTLDTIIKQVNEAEIKPPSIIIIGEVVSLRQHLQWYDNRPLSGKRIVVTRSQMQASGLVKKLKQLGAIVIELPTIQISPILDEHLIQETMTSLHQYNWIFFTSVNSITYFFNYVYGQGLDARYLHGLKIGVIGKETAKTLNSVGLSPDFMPTQYTAEGFMAELKEKQIDFKDKRVLLPTSPIARDFIPDEIKKMGGIVDKCLIYNTEAITYPKEKIETLFSTPIDLITFTSSSTVKNFVQMLQQGNKDTLIPTLKGVSIGPITSQTAQEVGISILKEASEHTIDGLVEAILSLYTNTKEE